MITNRIVENYLTCRRKALLAVSGQSGTQHEYEVRMNELRDEQRPWQRRLFKDTAGSIRPLGHRLSPWTIEARTSMILDAQYSMPNA